MASSKRRFVYVDALRGIAAMWVVVFHLYEKNLSPMTGWEFPEPIHTLFSNGRLGVYIFFVISGFVIAHSIQGIAVNWKFIGWFALRRSVRLDPPYWATIVAMIALTLVLHRVMHDTSLPLPDAAQVLAHLFYAHGFFGWPDIVPVFWTLCYEIQFYLALVLLVGAWQWLAGKSALLFSRWYVFAPLFGFSLVALTGILPFSNFPHAPLALHAWPYFFVGAVACWAFHRDVSAASFGVLLAVLVAFTPFEPLRISVAVVTALSIYLVARFDRLETLSLGRVLQYLGRISYSLYLVHMIVGTPLVRFAVRYFGKSVSSLHVSALLLAGIAVSVVGAHLMYVLIEQPAVRWSARLRRKSIGPLPTRESSPDPLS